MDNNEGTAKKNKNIRNAVFFVRNPQEKVAEDEF